MKSIVLESLYFSIILRYSFNFLTIGTAIPIIGIIPGVLIIGLGCVQTVGGLALSIFSVIPSYIFQSENAKIILHRSLKHISYDLI